jgi:hypothetical protein
MANKYASTGDRSFEGEYSMSITHCKSQQQTLSIRVSDSLRKFLELAREFITDGRGKAVSISDVAKVLLESARQDRLDFRLEAAELQQSQRLHSCTSEGNGTGATLSRAEWVFLAQYVQVACEERPGNTSSPSPRTLSSRSSKHCSRCAPSEPAAVVALTDSTFSERQFDPRVRST